MKTLIKTITLLTAGLFFVACTNGTTEGFTKSGKAGSLGVTYSSAKPLVTGDNTINIKVTENGKIITDATRVEFKVFMPEMPGMPYMESVKLMVPNGNEYSGNVNFSMGGTWQVKIFIEKDGKKYKHSSSVIL
ncbi:MAG TPA: hypothetical protein EYG67_05065 [Campylobacterales bacterium]|nr:hypothetical protein [Campylobacterales bacterium]HIP41077.1 hypothetical protein [Campylobacterales bacterium]